MVRCVGPQLMACWVGANLSCGKANVRRRLPGATAFCRDDPNAASIPMAATGHDTIYDWRCVNGRAVAGKAVGVTNQPAGDVNPFASPGPADPNAVDSFITIFPDNTAALRGGRIEEGSKLGIDL